MLSSRVYGDWKQHPLSAARKSTSVHRYYFQHAPHCHATHAYTRTVSWRTRACCDLFVRSMKTETWSRLMQRRPGSGVLKQADAQGKLHLNPFAGCPKRPTHSCHSIFFLSIRCPPPSPYWDLMAARGRHNLPPHHATTSKCCLVISGVQTGGRTRLWPGYQRISIWVWTSK